MTVAAGGVASTALWVVTLSTMRCPRWVGGVGRVQGPRGSETGRRAALPRGGPDLVLSQLPPHTLYGGGRVRRHVDAVEVDDDAGGLASEVEPVERRPLDVAHVRPGRAGEPA